MNIQVIAEEKDYLELKLVGEDLGMANMIAAQLMSSGAVTFANASLDHPITANPVLRIKGKEAKKEAVVKAIKDLAGKLEPLIPELSKKRAVAKPKKKKD